MAKSYENPLLPHARIREMYRAILQARVLGAEPAASDTAISLACGLRDLAAANVCAPDRLLDPALSLALGLTLKQVQRGSRAKQLQEQLSAKPVEQLYLALGSAASSEEPALLLLAADDLQPRQWRRLLEDAARLNAPVTFATLPGKAAGLARLADRCGIPGIPVDAADPVALYRVAGESFGRTCAGGGPVLIETLVLDSAPDALVLLRRQMIARGAATERWAARQEEQGRQDTAASPEKVH